LEDKGLGAGRLGDVRRGIPRSERLQARVKLAGGKKEEKDVRRTSVVQVNTNSEESAESQEED